MAKSIVQDLLSIEKAIVDATKEVADTATGVVTDGLATAAEAIREVIEAVTGSDS